MELGIYLYRSKMATAEEQVKLFKKYGINHTFIKSNRSDFYELMTLFRENGITCDTLHAPYKGINNMWGDDEEAGSAMLAELTDSVDKCAKYQIPTTIVHLSSGRPMPEIAPAGIARYETLFAYAREKGVTVALENLHYAENLSYFLDNYPECAFCWDCGHEYAYSHERYIPKYGHRLGALHLHDNRCGIDTDDHLLPFDGSIPMEQVAKDIAQSGYAGTLMLEIGRSKMHTYDDMSEEDYIERAVAAANKLNDLVESAKLAK
ncbi:MAG: sugar phosphate isomerase/epimerase [Oscillospiraceae bacterium]|nr:sugar phosphate isomerase/epimerase [Oscillospiraceae bacterium]